MIHILGNLSFRLRLWHSIRGKTGGPPAVTTASSSFGTFPERMSGGSNSPRMISRQRSDDFIAIAFSPDGTVIAALARRWVYVWPVTAFDRPPTEPLGIITIERAGYCRSMAYSQDGKQLAVACNDAGVRIFDASKFQLVKTITAHKNAVSDVAFSPDGTRLATASLDKTFHVSPLRFEELYAVAKRLKTATSGDKPQPTNDQ